jgi:plasmid stabilization system protein ParE
MISIGSSIIWIASTCRTLWIGSATSCLRSKLVVSPLIGRPVERGRRELVIGLRSQGYVALYRFVASTDTVFILAIRNQREAGYKPS